MNRHTHDGPADGIQSQSECLLHLAFGPSEHTIDSIGKRDNDFVAIDLARDDNVDTCLVCGSIAIPSEAMATRFANVQINHRYRKKIRGTSGPRFDRGINRNA